MARKDFPGSFPFPPTSSWGMGVTEEGWGEGQRQTMSTNKSVAGEIGSRAERLAYNRNQQQRKDRKPSQGLRVRGRTLQGRPAEGRWMLSERIRILKVGQGLPSL